MTRSSAPQELASALRSARERMGLTQEQLAQKLGVAIRTVARWESGTTAPKPAVLAALGLGTAGQAVGSLFGLVGGAGALGHAVGSFAGAAFLDTHKAAVDLRRERHLAGLNAVVNTLAEKYGFAPHAFARAAATLIVEMTEAGVSLEDLIVLLTSVDSVRPPAATESSNSSKKKSR